MKTAAGTNNQEHLLPECSLAQIADFVSITVRHGWQVGDWQVGDLPITTEPTSQSPEGREKLCRSGQYKYGVSVSGFAERAEDASRLRVC